MDDLFIIFVALAAIAGWASGYWWNKHEAARACTELEAAMKEKHAMDLRTLTAALADACADLRQARNYIQAIEESRAAKKKDAA